MDAGEVNMKERMMMTGMEYSVLKEEMEDDECGWSHRRLHMMPPRNPRCTLKKVILIVV
jgi:hypothetical protein